MWTVYDTPGALRTNWLSTFAKPTNANGLSTVSIFFPLLTTYIDIWKSCRDGDLDMVRILLREGQDVNEQT